ncbi:winged helix-turn-helix domain-containing protein [Streptomyces coeruleorubidus]
MLLDPPGWHRLWPQGLPHWLYATASTRPWPTGASRPASSGPTSPCARQFHVSHSVSGATRLMHRLGFSPQVPSRRVAERDETTVSTWKEATWAEVKEPGRHAGATSASRTRQASPAGRPGDAPGAGAATPRR